MLGFLAAVQLACVAAESAQAAAQYQPPALFTYGGAKLTSTSTITSVPSQSAAFYVKGTLTNAGTSNLSGVTVVKGGSVPLISVFMPDSRVTALTSTSMTPVPRPGGTTKYAGSLTINGASRDYGNIQVAGSLTISGSGTYTFGSVKVGGSMAVGSSSASPTVSIDSLQVGGALSVSNATLTKLGPTNVAGNVSLAGKGQWAMGLFVTAGSVTIGGTQTMGSAANPATLLMTGSGVALTYGNTAATTSFFGLLCNRYGVFTHNSGKIVGSVLCNGNATMKAGTSITYDPAVASKVFGVAPPTTTAAITSGTLGDNGWYTSWPVGIRLSATAADWASVAKVSYALSGAQTAQGSISGPTGTFTVPVIPYPVVPDGVYNVQYWATDTIGSVEAPGSLVISIDTTAPDTGIVSGPGDSAWSGDRSPTYDLSGSDNLTSLAQLSYQCQVDGGAWTACGSSCQPPSLTDGTHTIAFRALDRGGNPDASPAQRTVKIDSTAPAGVVTVNGGGLWTRSAAATLNLTSGDGDGSGVSQMQFRNESGDWSTAEPYAASKAWTLSEGDGAKTVSVRLIDAVGNPSTATIADDIGLDTTKPTASATADPSSWTSGSVSVRLTAADPTSGITAVTYSIDGGTSVPYLSDFSAGMPVMVTGEGVRQVAFTVTDAAGNSQTAQADAAIDTTAPVTTATGWSQDEWQPSAVPVTLEAADSGAGVEHTWYRIDGSGTDSFSLYDPQARPLVQGAGEHTVWFYSTDRAVPANSEDVRTATVLIDRTAPTTPQLSGADEAWHNTDVTVAAGGSTDDNTSVPLRYEHRLNSSGWEVGSSCTVKADHTGGSVEGENTVRFRAVDAAGNASEEASATVRIDTVAPNVTLTLDSPTEVVPAADGGSVLTSYYNEPVLTITPDTGTGSGLADDGLQLLDAATAIHGAASGQALPRPLSEGSHTLVATAVDLAGNATASEPVTFSVAAPPFTPQYSQPSEGDVVGLYADDTYRTGLPRTRTPTAPETRRARARSGFSLAGHGRRTP
jgi:hypothetical protein